MITVHMIGNAHLDPIWLWRKEDGVDAVLATTRSACDRLDEYPEFIFTCSTSWYHRQVEMLAPALWDRVRRFVAQGRWQLVGGMVVQPDCNLPSAESFDKQLELGQRYFERAFGRRTSVGYNVDSFGHTAWLPQRLRRAGIDAYCFMRPGPHEMDLPADFFRWQSPDGSEVTAFRIGSPYCYAATDLRAHIERAVQFLPPGVEHAMCFYGVGDHGGGPTKEQIEWLLANGGDPLGGGSVRAIFSHPRAAFDALAKQNVTLPLVAGELQHHAVGCYSVERRIKLSMRFAEGRLMQAQQAADWLAPNDDGLQADLDDAWESLCFNQFHDILGGTCLWNASTLATGELIAAGAKANDALTAVTRRAMGDLSKPGEHRIVAANPADREFTGFLTHEPWVRHGAEALDFQLFDEQGQPVPTQTQDPSYMVCSTQLLFPLTIPARSRRVLELRMTPKRDAGVSPALDVPLDQSTEVKESTSQPDAGKMPASREAPALDAPQGLLRIDGDTFAAGDVRLIVGERDLRINDWRLRLDVVDDPTDTWSHSAGNRFADETLGAFAWSQTAVANNGPLRADVRSLGQFDRSLAWCRAMVHKDSDALSILLRVTWAQARQRLCLRLIPPSPIRERTDLVSGGPLSRNLNGCEYPLGGGMIVRCGAGGLTLAAPDVFSANATPEAVTLTLLRSPLVAHHDPFDPARRPDHPVTDQGSHEFHLTLWPTATLTPPQLIRHVDQHLMPPVVWDAT